MICGTIATGLKMDRIIALLGIGLSVCSPGVAANRFVEGGVPSPTHEWHGGQYTRAAEVLKSGALGLPTYDGADGEAIFRRMIDSDNFSFARDSSLPLRQRMGDLLAIQKSANVLVKKYLEEANQDARMHREIAGLCAFSLRMETVVLAQIDEFVSDLPRDKDYEKWVEDSKKEKRKKEGIVLIAEQLLADKGFFTTEDSMTVIVALAETLPRLKSAFSDGFRTELAAWLKKRARGSDQPEARALFESMLKDLASPGASSTGG